MSAERNFTPPLTSSGALFYGRDSAPLLPVPDFLSSRETDGIEAKRRKTLMEHREVVYSLSPFVASETKRLLPPPTEVWQPGKFVPNHSHESYHEDVKEFGERSKSLSPALLVVSAGNTITEEGLGLFVPALVKATDHDMSLVDISISPWNTWNLGWAGEEHRHEILLYMYHYLSKRYDIEQLDTTIHGFLRNGFQPGIGNDVYRAFIYTSFQERATNRSHNNVSLLARQMEYPNGVPTNEDRKPYSLYDICNTIAKDEAKHEAFYKGVMKKIFDIDPDGAMIAFHGMMKTGISMPAARMDNTGELPAHQKESNIFQDYSVVAQKIGVYTAHDYAEIFEHLMKVWKVKERKVTSVEAEKAKLDLIRDLERGKYRRLARGIQHNVEMSEEKLYFPWLAGEKADRIVDLKNPGPILQRAA